MKELKAEIIAVGTELLLGQIANTNAKWLSEQLAFIGVNTFYHSVVGDNLDRLVNVFSTAKNRSNVIIVMGGLGPTTDDLTREGFQKISNLPIIEEKKAMKKILDFYKSQQMKMSENNRRQARVFERARVLDNKLGMAPGMIVNYAQKLWIFLPGVPREMKQIARDFVLPYLQSVNGDETVIQSRILRLIGIGESTLEEKLSHLIDGQTNPTIALLAQNDGNIIRLTAKAATKEKAQKLLDQYEQLIEEKVGQYIYGIGQKTIEETVYELLQQKGKLISAAESLTGGLFSERLINVPGASKIIPGSMICYDTKIKRDVLKVSAATLQQFGAVSEQCATEMAKNVAKMYQTDYGISFTGVAGPKRSEGKPVGTVYIAIYDQYGKSIVEKVFFQGDRYSIRHRAVLKGYELLLKVLKT